MVEAIGVILALAVFVAFMAMLVGVVFLVTRKQWKVLAITGPTFGGLFIVFVIFMGVTGQLDDTEQQQSPAISPASTPEPTLPPEPTATPQPTPTPESKFNCRDLELEYINMSMLGYETALQHVSNVMSLQDDNPFAFYTSGDAERELQNCGVIPR